MAHTAAACTGSFAGRAPTWLSHICPPWGGGPAPSSMVIQSLQCGSTEVDTTTKHPEHPQLQHRLQVPLSWQQTFSMECFQPEQPQQEVNQVKHNPGGSLRSWGCCIFPSPASPF